MVVFLSPSIVCHLVLESKAIWNSTWGDFMAYTINTRYIYNTQKLVLCHIIKIYMHALSFPLVEFTHIACVRACVLLLFLHLLYFAIKFSFWNCMRFIRINGGFVRLHCMYYYSSIRLIRVKRIIRWQKGIIEHGAAWASAINRYGNGWWLAYTLRMQSICGCKYKRVP